MPRSAVSLTSLRATSVIVRSSQYHAIEQQFRQWHDGVQSDEMLPRCILPLPKAVTRCSLPLRTSPWRYRQLSTTRGACYQANRSPLHSRLQVLQPRLNAFAIHQQKRTLFGDVIPAVLVPPVVFGGLVLTLWMYKCLMMILFQNKIIYMPSVPPFSRQEKIADYANICKPVVWEEKRIRSLDGTEIALCVGGIRGSEEGRRERDVIVLYFQGNASSLPPRLPSLSNVLKALNQQAASPHSQTQYTIVALSYRGFWTSRGRASQKGIEQDASAALAWVQETYGDPSHDVRLVLWGQSIGAGVAADAAAWHVQQPSSSAKHLSIRGMILETPFVSIRNMLVALYPQKWLPYRYLWPFLRNWWDSEAALRTIAERKGPEDMPILLVAASRDEVVPPDQADQLEELCREVGLQVRRRDVPGALHTEAMAKREGQTAVVEFLKDVAKG